MKNCPFVAHAYFYKQKEKLDQFLLINRKGRYGLTREEKKRGKKLTMEGQGFKVFIVLGIPPPAQSDPSKSYQTY